MKNELLFIKNCFNIHYSKQPPKKIAHLVKKSLDWDFILEKLAISDIAPLASYNLSHIKNKNIPREFLDSLDAAQKNAMAKNLLIWKSLEEISADFDSERIPAIPVKGAFMADIIYKDVALRPLADIDLLIKEPDLGKIDAIMLKNACTKSKKGDFSVNYIKEKMVIDLHYKLNFPSPLSITHDFIWERARKKGHSGTGMLYPSIEDAVIYTALHFFHHISDAFLYNAPLPPLKHILDIHEIISRKRNEIDWDYILRFSKKYNIRYILYLSLILSKIYFKTAVPHKVINKISPPLIRNKILMIFIKKYINLQARRINYYPKKINCVYYALFEKPYFKHRLFRPVKDFAEEYGLPHPSLKTYCLYLLRPFLTLFYLKKCS